MLGTATPAPADVGLNLEVIYKLSSVIVLLLGTGKQVSRLMYEVWL
jgi:hypothetical protein